MDEIEKHFRLTAINQLRGLQKRFDSAAQSWPGMFHRITAFEHWDDCKSHIGTNAVQGRKLRKTDLSESVWTSGEDPHRSRFWLVSAGGVYVLGEFTARVPTANSVTTDVFNTGIEAFCSLADQSFDVLDRSLDRLSGNTVSLLRRELGADPRDLPAHPWIAFVYRIARGYYSPGIMAEIQLASRAEVVTQLVAHVGEERLDVGEFKTVNDAFLGMENYRHVQKGRFGFVIRPREVAVAPLQGCDKAENAILRDILPNGSICLTHDVFSSSWTALDLVCQWLEGVSMPVQLGPNDENHEPEKIKAGCRSRDQIWKEWWDKGFKHAAIRDRWNGLSDDERRTIASECHEKVPSGKTGAGRVKSALKRLERPKKAAGKKKHPRKSPRPPMSPP